MSQSRRPPQNIEAERSVLGAILLDPNVLDDVVDLLGKKPSDVFFSEAHQHLYAAMLKVSAAQVPVDAVLLIEALGSRLEAAGGMSYIAGLTGAVPTSANVEHYARLVKDSAAQRKVIRACSQLMESAYNPREETVEDIIVRGQVIFDSIESNTATGKTHHVFDVVEAVVEDVDRLLKSEASAGIPMPWSWWNSLIGGLAYGEFAMLMARPNVGKTAMMLNIAHHAAQRNVPVLILSLEMNKEKLAQRLLNIDSGVDFKRIEKRWQVQPELEKLKHGAINVGKMSMWINDTSIQSASDVRAACRRHEKLHGRGLVLVDYLQFVNTPKFDKLNIELGDVVKAFARIPKETGHHLLSLGQLSRDADAVNTGYEKWHKGAGTSEIEKTADMGFVLHAPKAKEKKSMASSYGCEVSEIDDCFHLTLAKNRNGPTGDGYLRFLKDRQRFHEVTLGKDQPPEPENDPNEAIDEDLPY